MVTKKYTLTIHTEDSTTDTRFYYTPCRNCGKTIKAQLGQLKFCSDECMDNEIATQAKRVTLQPYDIMMTTHGVIKGEGDKR